MAGAKAYAAKFATSPTATISESATELCSYIVDAAHTCTNTTPPKRALHVFMPAPFKSVSFFCFYQTLRDCIRQSRVLANAVPRVAEHTFFVMTKLLPERWS